MHWLLKTPLTHRGLFNNISVPENSLAAFDASAKAGYPIELDIRILSDGHLAVFHDTFLRRMTGRRGSVLKLHSKELKYIRLLETDQYIPLLSEVFEVVNGRVPLLLEIKNRKQIGLLESRLLNMLNNYKGEFAIESFNPLSVKWFKENAPHILRGQLSGGIGAGKIALKNTPLKATFLSRLSQPDFIAYDIKFLPARTITKLREKGYPIIGYTAKSREQYENARKYCDNVIFEGFIPQ